jgi:hypothetical protein
MYNKIVLLKLRLLLAEQMLSKQEKLGQQAGVLFKKMKNDKDQHNLLGKVGEEPLGSTQVFDKTPFSAKKTAEYFAPKQQPQREGSVVQQEEDDDSLGSEKHM